MNTLLAEIMGLDAGCCRGRGGSMHLCNPKIGVLGTNAIVGGGIPLAIGSAFAEKYRKSGNIVVSFFGDGATNQGAFHEALNLAGLWKLPVIFALENNRYAVETSLEESSAVSELSIRAAAYGLKGRIVNGNDPLAVKVAFEQAARSLRNGDAAPYFIDLKEKNPSKIWNSNKEKFKEYDLLIVDTAGRDALSDDLILEINTIYRRIKPNENLLVISADIGQAAEKQAKTFHDACAITGVIVTKLEGTAKGGGALTASAATGSHIKFIGVGEKADDLEQFNPKGFVGRLLGMGDLEALLEKAKDAISEEDAEDLGKKFLKGDFNLIDLYEQMEAVGKMGPLSKIVEMIPGFSQIKLPKEALQVQEGKLKTWRYMMNSMSREELEDPEIIDMSRIDRIAKGSGMTPKDVRELIKQYKQSKKMVKLMKGGDRGMQRLMKKFGGNIPPDMKF
ncbi:MAG: thiamine pyrophosphate-dependent enzyme [Chrysiogenales bacterium]